MTDETKSGHPVLPPGWEWRELVGDSYPFNPGCDWVTADPEDLFGTAERCWAYWAGLSGVSRERWEQMERDHQAIEALRQHIPERGHCQMSFLACHPDDRGRASSGFWSADDPADACQSMAAIIRKVASP